MRGARTERSVTELIAAAQAGDQRSWEEIMARFGGLVRTVVASFRLQDADAADAAQNTWLRAVERLHTVREPERFGGWLRTTARRECLALPSMVRREQPDDVFSDLLVEAAPGPEALLIDQEVTRAVRSAVDGLTGRRRVLVDALFYQQHADYTVVARLVEMPVGSIGPTRARILGILRADLEQSGFGHGAGEPAAPDRVALHARPRHARRAAHPVRVTPPLVAGPSVALAG